MKRGILAKQARIYDPLGLISPETLCGELVYHAVCDSKRAWDAELSRDLAKAWIKWESGLPQSFEVPRSLATHREEIEEIELHSFGDASTNGIAACVYEEENVLCKFHACVYMDAKICTQCSPQPRDHASKGSLTNAELRDKSGGLLECQHPEGLILITGDFNPTLLLLPSLPQIIDVWTRDSGLLTN